MQIFACSPFSVARQPLFSGGGQHAMNTREIVNVLEHAGFKRIRDGRHMVFSNGNKTVPVPHHKGTLPTGLQKGILRQAGLSLIG